MSAESRRARVAKLRKMAADPALSEAARATYREAADRIEADIAATASRSGSYWYTPGYDDLIRSLGYDVLADLDIGSYQGDSLVALRDGARHGLLTYGWGSCSGCDALQACGNEREVGELREQLRGQIIWIDGLVPFKEMVRTRDWDAVSYIDAADARPFVDAVLAIPQTAIAVATVALPAGTP